ncbi:MAG: hypothetical protein ACK5MT_05640 [Actinomycetales bacterium]
MSSSLDDAQPRVHVVDPSRDDPLVAALSEVVGGPVGRFRAPVVLRAWATRALVMASVFSAVAMLAALWVFDHCRQTLWKAPGQFTHLCYSDITAFYSSGGLGDGVVPYLGTSSSGYLAQPVGTGGLLALLGLVTPGGRDELRWVFDAAAVLLTGCLIVTVVAVGVLAGRRAWDAALVACSPVVVFSALLSLDLAAVALGTVALLAFSRGRVLTGGVLLGLGIAVRPVELVLLAAVLLVAARRPKPARGPAGVFAVATLLGWLMLNVPVALVSWQGWSAYFAVLWRADIGYGSLWLIPQLLSAELEGQTLPTPPLWIGGIGVLAVFGYSLVMAVGPREWRAVLAPVNRTWMAVIGLAVIAVPMMLVATAPSLIPALAQPLPESAGRWIALIGYPLALAGIWYIVRSAPVGPPRVAPVALMLLLGLLLVSPAIPVQASIWLLPLVALSLPSWRLALTWAAMEVFYGSMTWLYLYGLSVPDRGAPVWLYLVALLARVGMYGWLFWRAWSISVWQQDDPIRRDVGDDPLAGPLLASPEEAPAAQRAEDAGSAPEPAA